MICDGCHKTTENGHHLDLEGLVYCDECFKEVVKRNLQRQAVMQKFVAEQVMIFQDVRMN